MSKSRILYSFPHRIGGNRICALAWNQAVGLASQGADVTVFADSIATPLPSSVRVHQTLSIGALRVPRRLAGRWLSCNWHDIATASWLRNNHHSIDSLHCWPLGSLRTLKVAKQFGIPSFLERPNAHTAFAYDVVAQESKRLGISLPPGHDHTSNPGILAREIEEYQLADFLLCPSDFVARTFRDRGFAESKLLRHQYGFDPSQYSVGSPDPHAPLVVLFAGACEPRKGLHIALNAWLKSGVQNRGKFLICGEFVPEYREKIADLLAHPSVEFLGHRRDLGQIMKQAHIFTLPSLEEGSALVTYEARGAGSVLLVSTASGAVCQDGVNALLHEPKDSDTLAGQFAELDRDRVKLATLRRNSLADRDSLTWERAAEVLFEIHRRFTDSFRLHRPDVSPRETVASAA